MTESEEQRLRDRVLAKRAEEDRWRSRIQAKMGGVEGVDSGFRRNVGPPPPMERRHDRSRSPRDYHHRPSYHRNGGRGPPRRDDFGRQARAPPRRGRSYSRSYSRSRSYSSSSSGSSSGSSRSRSRSASSHSSDSSEEDKTYSKDQRTVFINQLVMKANENDLRRFFKSMNIKTRDVILLRDKRTGKHKGFAYVELKHMHDVNRALQASEKVPDFQRFPILIKASEAEKNNVTPTSSQVVAPKKLPPIVDDHGNVLVAQKVYVGNLEVSQVTAQHIQTLFAPFGTLEEVQLQTGKGFAFLQFRDPKEAALAIQSMAGQKLAGRAMKTGWATSNPHAVTATDFPPDATTRIQNAYAALASLTMGSATATVATTTTLAAATVPGTVAEARLSLAAASIPAIVAPVATVPVPPMTVAVPPKKETFIANANNPTNSLIIYNMFDKDQETEPGWPKDIELEFIEECTKYGPIDRCVVAYREVGGKIYATFRSGAQSCASSLAGRWFDKRQLRVEFVEASMVDSKAKEYGM